MQNELRRLHRSGYVLGKLDGAFVGYDFLMGPVLSDRGARAVGKWPPAEAYDLLLQLLDRRISSAASQEERSKWQRIRDGVVDVGTSAGGALIVEAVKALAGLA